MILQVDNWVFDVDIPATMAYSSGVWDDHCTCGYCRNFYETLNGEYPQLRDFLKQFGMNSLTPEELSPIEPTLCMLSYCISGKVIKNGVFPIDLGGVVLSVAMETDPLYQPSFGQPFFVFNTGLLELPWVLEEDMDEVISPANEPEYLQRMMNKLLENAEEDTIIS